MIKLKRQTSIPAVFALAIFLIAARGEVCSAAQYETATATAQIAPSGQYGPVISASNQTVTEGQTVEFEILASDSNTEDTVTLEITQGQASWLTIVSNVDGNPAKMALRAQPQAGDSGTFRVYFKATDDSTYDLYDTADIYITVNPANNTPSISASNQNVLVNGSLNFTVNVQDADAGDTVTLTYSGKPSWLNASTVSPATGNPINITFSGTAPASPQTSTMTFSAQDNGSPQRSSSKQITITVSAQNSPPVLAAIRDKQVPVRVTLRFAIKATDPNGDTLTYSATGLPSGASFNSGTRTFSWTPGIGQEGNYTVHFEVSDGSLTASEDIVIRVTAEQAPVFDPVSDQYGKVGRTMSFSVHATDPNNDPLHYTASNMPTGAVFVNDTDRTFRWTPASGQEGSYQNVTFSATDGTYTATKQIWIFISHQNAPEFNAISDRTGRVGQAMSFTVSATDPNGDSLSYSTANLPAGASFIGQTFSWTPVSGQEGAHSNVTFNVTDGTYTDSKQITISVLSSGAPTLTDIADQRIREGRTLTLTVTATDPNGDPLTYSASNLPVGSVFNPSTRTFTWTPARGEAGIYQDLRFQVTDGTDTVYDDIWIYVTQNGAPIIDPPLSDKYIKAGQTVSFGVSAYDPDGDSLTYKVVNAPSGSTFTNRTFTWTPTAAQVGTYPGIIFEVTDGTYITTDEVWIFVRSSGAPTITDIPDKYVTVGQTLTFTVSATDPDGDPLTYSASNLPQGASFNSGTRQFSWTPALDQVGNYADVVFTVTDGTYTVSDAIWIFVESNAAPAINNLEDQHIKTGQLLEFTVTANDPDGDPLTYSASNLPEGATFTNQVFSWTPDSDQIGTYPDVVFTVTDGTYTDSEVIWIFVRAYGAPDFSQDITDKYGREGEPITFSVTATDPDHTLSQLTFSAFNLPSGASFANQTFNWTPSAGQAGTYRDVRLEVRDPDNNIDTDAFWIFISDNSAPQLDNIGAKFGNAGVSMSFSISASDPDGDSLTFSASNLPSGATFNPSTKVFNWASPVVGTYSSVHFEVTDGAYTDSENITITVNP